MIHELFEADDVTCDLGLLNFQLCLHCVITNCQFLCLCDIRHCNNCGYCKQNAVCRTEIWFPYYAYSWLLVNLQEEIQQNCFSCQKLVENNGSGLVLLMTWHKSLLAFFDDFTYDLNRVNLVWTQCFHLWSAVPGNLVPVKERHHL